jgi:hypothetical protein
MMESLLRNQGYKPTMVRGEIEYCRREAPLGSRLATTQRCMTVAEARVAATEAQQTAQRIQRTTPGCLATGNAPTPTSCGN